MIKKRNLDPALKNWIMSEAGLGPIIGNVYYVAPVVSTTSHFREAMADAGIDTIYATLAEAYAKTVTDRNDVIIVAPGIYTTTAELAWTKDCVHLIGSNAGMPNGDWTLTPGCPVFTTATITQANILNLTGERNTFHNIIFENYGNNAACLQAVTVDGYGNSFYNCGFNGVMLANQISTAAACSLNIAGGAYYSYFENCLIGQSEWGIRTSTTQGQVRFTSTSASPAYGHFNKCVFRSHAETAGVPMVYVAAQYAAGGYWRYTDCLFFNFWTNYASKCSAAFSNNGVSSQWHVLERCTAVGYTEWITNDTGEWVVGAIQSSGSGGGVAEILNAAAEA